MIEANSTYRGWFVGGEPVGRVGQHRVRHGARRRTWARSAIISPTLLNGTIKMGDSPSVGYLLHGTPEDPVAAGMGRKVRAHLGRPQNRLHAADHGGRSGGSVRRGRVRACRSRRHDAHATPRGCSSTAASRSKRSTTAACCASAFRRATPRCGRTGSAATSRAWTACRASSPPCRPRSSAPAAPLCVASQLVDRRSRSGRRGGRPSRRQAREPLAPRFSARFRRPHGALPVGGLREQEVNR